MKRWLVLFGCILACIASLPSVIGGDNHQESRQHKNTLKRNRENDFTARQQAHSEMLASLKLKELQLDHPGGVSLQDLHELMHIEPAVRQFVLQSPLATMLPAWSLSSKSSKLRCGKFFRFLAFDPDMDIFQMSPMDTRFILKDVQFQGTIQNIQTLEGEFSIFGECLADVFLRYPRDAMRPRLTSWTSEQPQETERFLFYMLQNFAMNDLDFALNLIRLMDSRDFETFAQLCHMISSSESGNKKLLMNLLFTEPPNSSDATLLLQVRLISDAIRSENLWYCQFLMRLTWRSSFLTATLPLIAKFSSPKFAVSVFELYFNVRKCDRKCARNIVQAVIVPSLLAFDAPDKLILAVVDEWPLTSTPAILVFLESCYEKRKLVLFARLLSQVSLSKYAVSRLWHLVTTDPDEEHRLFAKALAVVYPQYISKITPGIFELMSLQQKVNTLRKLGHKFGSIENAIVHVMEGQLYQIPGLLESLKSASRSREMNMHDTEAIVTALEHIWIKSNQNLF